MKILVLEDDPQRVFKFKELFFGQELYITKDPKEANQWLDEIEFDVISLDHDLAEEAQGTDNNFDVGTGLEVANFLGKNPHLSPLAVVFIHSLNYQGAVRMQTAMNTREKEATHVPFLWLKSIDFN